MKNCIIVDDEPLAQQIMEDHVCRIPELRLIKTCSNALEAFGQIHQSQIHLVFLDIQMPGVSGIDFIRSIKNPPEVVFTTAFPEYAVKSYELEALDYLLKPVTFERFNLTISKFLKKHIVQEPLKNYTYFKVDGSLVKVYHADILFAQSIKDYIIISTPKQKYIIHMTMKFLVNLLPGDMFIRVHRSFMIGTTHITVIGRNFIELDTLRIPVGENYKSEVLHLSKPVL
jgi:DNA-binding LytR/AlgR family response regulator